MAEVKRFTGSVPPTFIEYFDVTLAPGTYYLSQLDQNASLDGFIQDQTDAPVYSFAESAYRNTFTIAGWEVQPLRMRIEQYSAGGPFDVLIENEEGGTLPDPAFQSVQMNVTDESILFNPMDSNGNTYQNDVVPQFVTYPEGWGVYPESGPSFRLIPNSGTPCNVPAYGRYYLSLGEVNSEAVNFAVMLVGCSDPPPVYYEAGDPPQMSYVYEAEKGWSFDGNYIPHYAEVNWYFGDNPVDYTSIQKVRIHGLSQGRALISVAANGIQQDGYDEMYSEPQWVDLPRNSEAVLAELMPKTNYTDQANRGLAIQLMFEGRNTDIARPEPGHVLQVLVVQSSPVGTGARSN